MQKAKQKKVLFAVGGTGGHLFPAQALARELKEKCENLDLLFVGSKLASNPFFQKSKFVFREIASGSPYKTSFLTAGLKIGKGTFQSLKLIKEFSPDLIVGFGSFYSFPLLLAACHKKVPFILFESNAIPGKVNRLFSSKAKLTALQFEEAKLQIKGPYLVTKMPCWCKEKETDISQPEARKYYDLDPEKFTLLVFGGSKGAEKINNAVASLELSFPFQILHFTGKNTETYKKMYQSRGIKAHVKAFEERMFLAWRASDIVIARSGAGTLNELLIFETPGILIPWPGSADQHQEKNAKVIESLGGAIHLPEDQLTAGNFSEKIISAKEKLLEMQQNIIRFKGLSEKKDLSVTLLKLLK